jgi:hypothetical protein
MNRPALGVTTLLLAATAAAHHSTVAIYDGSRTVEVTGIVESVHWRNPHGEIVLSANDQSGGTAQWEIETPAIVVLRIRNIGDNFIHVGDRITIAGHPARRDPHGMTASNILLASGYELALGNKNEPYFPAGKNGNLVGREFDESGVDEAIEKADGVFRVWSTNFGDPAAFPLFKGNYPLTTAGAAAKAEWDPLDNELLNCGTKGHPLIMITPAPVEFVREGDTIVMNIEEYDSRRVIHMNPDAVAPESEYTQMGFSRGRFDGETLVVETDHLQEQYFEPDGVRQSTQMRTVERFIPNEDYSRLDYRITVTDPVNFTEPFDLTRYFVWRPGVEVEPYNCLERDWRVRDE